MIKIFNTNPKRSAVALSDNELEKLCVDSPEQFSSLALYHRGESKEIRRTSVPGILIQKLLPSLSSITERRKGMLADTEKIRSAITRIFWDRLHERNIPTCYLAQKDEYALMMEERIPPIEVIVKAAMVGTPTRIYHGLFRYRDRYGKRIVENELHQPYVRFDYRNPLQDENGEFLRDECMPVQLADRFIDTDRAESNALKIFGIVQKTLKTIELQVLDGCFFFDETGSVLCSEISPDNMRLKSRAWAAHDRLRDDFDKDLWRKRADDKLLTQQWSLLQARLETLEQSDA